MTTPPGERLTIPAGFASCRLDAFLTARPGAPSRSQLRAAIDRGEVRVNGRPVKAGFGLRPGDVVELSLGPPPPPDALPEPIPLHIVDEDELVLVIHKPAGMVVHPAPGHRSGTLVNALLHHYAAEMAAFMNASIAGPLPDDEPSPTDLIGEVPLDVPEDAAEDAAEDAPEDAPAAASTLRPGIVHRIDRDTSGLLVIAKTPAAHAFLSAQFAAHTATRTYWALCHAPAFPDNIRIESLIARHTSDRKRFATHATRGKRAVTHAQTLERFGDGAALIACRLETGRTHQIRVHLSEHRAPLLGDPIYGGKAASQSSLIRRAALHALTLGFTHPDGTPRLYHAPPPPDFTEALAALRSGLSWR
jgi:23S rRNA pseudouridine1911/1915/1917 synthase